ncbi:hypothetical protein WS69_09290 [Burkholderia sp. BDU5]|nr:hypothetical protein WS69_09290 [Burkholderia sp. BDU5]
MEKPFFRRLLLCIFRQSKFAHREGLLVSEVHFRMFDTMSAVDFFVPPGGINGGFGIRIKELVLVIHRYTDRCGVHDKAEPALGQIGDGAATVRQLRVPDDSVACFDAKGFDLQAGIFTTPHDFALVVNPEVI